jgi:hypothetical protein
VVWDGYSQKISIPASGTIARVKQEFEDVDDIAVEIDGIPEPVMMKGVKSYFGDIIDLPEPQEGVGYIVSSLVASNIQVRGIRDDLYFPAKPVRDKDGNVTSCMALGKFTKAKGAYFCDPHKNVECTKYGCSHFFDGVGTCEMTTKEKYAMEG